MAHTKPPIIPVILAGGAGKRLYPISTPECPKPFVCLPNGQSLLYATLRRVQKLGDVRDIIVVADARYAALAQQEMNAACSGADIQQHLLLESTPHNTAAAIAFAAHYAKEIDGDDACLWVVPADQWVAQETVLIDAVRAANAAAENQKMLLFGVAPTHASIAYGYLHQGVAHSTISNVFSVNAFIEKPNQTNAENYFSQGGYVWNSGMVFASAGVIWHALESYAPALSHMVQTQKISRQIIHPSLSLWPIDAMDWQGIVPQSFDYAVLEKMEELWMVVIHDVGWSDMGTPEAFEQLKRMGL